MQLKIYYIVLLALGLFSCNSYNENDQELDVISYIYKRIPKNIQIPPPLQNNDGLDSIGNSESYSSIKPLKFNYAIYEQFVNSGLERKISKSFFKTKTNKLFERENIDSKEMELVKQLQVLDHDVYLDKELLKTKTGEDLLFVNQSIITKQEQEKYHIDGVICFSRVAFNADNNMAALGVGVYRDGLDSSLTVYILENIDNKWSVKYYLVIEES